MKSTLFNKFLLLFCFCILIFAQQIEGQTTKKSKSKKKTVCNCLVDYDKLINYLFPTSFLGKGNGYALVLKYTPPFEPEIQINIFHSEPGIFEIHFYKYKPKSESDSISIQLEKIQEKNCNTSFTEIVKQIKVEKRKGNLSESEVLKIRADFLELAKKSSDFENKLFENRTSDLAAIIFDRTGYEVSYYGEGRIRLYGEGNIINGKPASEEPPFIEWMREVYRIVNKKNP